MSTSNTPPPQSPLLKRRGAIVVASACVIVAVGAYAGAMLKTNVQQKQAVQRRAEESVEERIERLRGYRLMLELQKSGIEEKLKALREKGKMERS